MRDRQQFDDSSGRAENVGVHESIWAYFGVVWPSSEILARLMADFDIRNKRILEVGCGIGLASLLLNSRSANITATDHHPDADAFLQWNVTLNTGKPIPFIRTGWEEEPSSLGEFDLIIGSDLLYQPDHPELLSGFICQHAKESCEVVIVDPSRGRANKFSKEMMVQGFVLSDVPTTPYQLLDTAYKGRITSYHR